MNPPKQRLSIFLEQDPAAPWTADALFALLQRMEPATGEAPLVVAQ
jgi:hypothetical protein